jgi:hypothetical protein
LSNGRDARFGSSLRRESARIASKPATPTFVIGASLPPVIMASTRPLRISPIASPIAMFDAAHAVH